MPRLYNPDFVELHVGRRVRELRQEARLSLEALAAALNFTHQQVQKYETGKTRLTISIVFQFAGALGVTVEQLLEGLPAPTWLAGMRSVERTEWVRFLALPDARAVVTGFIALPNEVQTRIASLVTAIAAAPTESEVAARAAAKEG